MFDSHRVKNQLCSLAAVASVTVLVIPLISGSQAVSQMPAAVSAGPSASLVRSRECEQALTRVQALLLTEPVLAASRLQQLLDSAADAPLTVQQGQFQGIRETVFQILRSQPASFRKVYEDLATLTAGRLLEQAHATRNCQTYEEIARRFYPTAAGFEAVNMLATRCADRGELETAYRLWDILLTDPLHQHRVTLITRVKAAQAAKELGNGKPAEALVNSQPRGRLRIGASMHTVDSYLYSSESQRARGSMPISLQAPAFPPRWVQSLAVEEPAASLEAWEEHQLAEGHPLLSTSTAIVERDQLFVRDPAGFRIISLATGEMTVAGNLADPPPLRPEQDLDATTPEWSNTIYGNCVLGSLASDGRRIYVLDHAHEHHPPQRDHRYHSEIASEGRTADVLSAYTLPAPTQKQKLSWRLAPRYTVDGKVIADRKFLGPPVFANGNLLVLTEQRQAVSLLALSPETGAVLWEQALCNVPTPLVADEVRAVTLCQPVVHAGIAVCPTNAGFLIGYDLKLRKLAWVRDYGGMAAASQKNLSEGDDTRIAGHPHFPSQVHCRKGRVYYLPPDHAEFQCLEVSTGRLVWTRARDQELAIAAVDDTGVLTVNSYGCQHLSLADGAFHWSCRLGAIAGTGLLVQGPAGQPRYLLPLAEGRIVALDPQSGRSLGFDLPRQQSNWEPAAALSLSEIEKRQPQATAAEATSTAVASTADSAKNSVKQSHDSLWRPGNLVLTSAGLISIRPRNVTLLPSADSALAALCQEEPTPARQLERARCCLAGGNLDAAEGLLNELLAGSDAACAPSARPLLRELCYLRLKTADAAEAESLIAKIGQLIDDSEEWGRLHLTSAQHDLRVGNTLTLLERAKRFAALDLSRPIPIPGDETRLISAESWIPEVVRRLEKSTDEATIASLREFEAGAASNTLGDRAMLFLTSQAASAHHHALANEAIAKGNLQEAELHMLQGNLLKTPNHWSRDARADLRVACLHFPNESRKESFEPELKRTVDATVVAATPADPQRVTSVTISGESSTDVSPSIRQIFSDARRKFYFRGQHPFCVVDRGDIRDAKLALINLDRGVCLTEVEVPSRLRFPIVTRQPEEGHFFPITTVGMVHGLSLLETDREKPLWNTEVPGKDVGVLPQIGPYSASFCAIQTRGELSVLEPRSGRIRWQRTHLSPEAGLHSHFNNGLLGDEQVLMLRDKDGESYVTFNTVTGERIGRGTLPVDLRRQPRAFGRRLFFVETGPDQSTARLWDALTQTDDCSFSFQGKLLTASVGHDELLLLFGDGRLVLLDCTNGKRKFEALVGAKVAEKTHNLQAIVREGMVIVSLYQVDVPGGSKDLVEQFVNDLPIASNNMQGQWIAFEHATGERLWERTSGQRTVFSGGPSGPFIIAIARLLHTLEENRKTILIEAIDPATGKVLAAHNSLMADEILQVHHQVTARRVQLGGMKSTINLDYELNRPLLQNEGMRISLRMK